VLRLTILEARQDLLEQEITAELRTRVSELAGRYLASAREVLAVVDSWRGTLEVVREHAIAGRNVVDAARRAADASPVQRYLPLPATGLGVRASRPGCGSAWRP